MNEAILRLRVAYVLHPAMFGLKVSRHMGGLLVWWKCHLSGESGMIGKCRIDEVAYVGVLLEELRRLRRSADWKKAA